MSWLRSSSYRLLQRSMCGPCFLRRSKALPSRAYSSSPSSGEKSIKSILAEPNWSVRSLLPDQADKSKLPSISPKELHHLLRLSALPQPSSEAEEAAMLETLESQIHFVKEIQRVDTTGVTPLRSIRDESPEALKESAIGLDKLKDEMAKEKVVGRNGKIQRIQTEKCDRPDGDAWDGNALGYASKTMGKFFVVHSSN